MIMQEYKRDESQQIRFSLFSEVISEYSKESDNPSKYKRLAENLCNKIKIVGPKSHITLLIGFKNHGEYFSSGSNVTTKEIAKKYIHRKVMEKLNGEQQKNRIANGEDNKQPLHQQIK